MPIANLQYKYIEGIAKWYRPAVPNPWGKYSHVIYPNDDGLEVCRELQAEGMKNKLNKDEDGWFITFTRPASKEMKGKLVGFAPPLTYEADGKTLLRDTNVGNGSRVITELEVYEHKTPGGGKAKAARWLSSKILDLIPYDGTNKSFEERQKMAEGYEDKNTNAWFQGQ